MFDATPRIFSLALFSSTCEERLSFPAYAKMLWRAKSARTKMIKLDTFLIGVIGIN